ncbi:Sorting nexin-41 [Neolecta irregularis DAH-3]|uniref:Sorting nexin-41 n=1 Tax=Neolecta irregularis (strain DAH-3) TaxID=1198029 RepID=A0A1U7LVI7_NEOID|nr:Sorting nexin-41 [Neolecta irregularis DAH-3]|eukprot:OLL26639.1 Sorting nexin-41 [Neolecta irregularis DAH-3]
MSSFEDNNPFAADGSVSPASSDHKTDYLDGVSARRQSITSTGDHSDFHPIEATDAQYPRPRSGNCCRIERFLCPPDGPNEIVVTDAGKSSEGSGASFIVYTINIGDYTVRRRYSEFESFRISLTRLFPTVIIPPIPEKHTMCMCSPILPLIQADYAAAPTKAKEDQNIIDHRKRMLQVFLNRCAALTQLQKEHVFHRFLDSNASWSEVLTSPPLSLIPKNVLKAPPLDPASAESSPNHQYLPTTISSSHKNKSVDPSDQEFIMAEASAKEFEAIIGGGVDKVNRRMMKRYSELANDYAELGARYNGFSLSEFGSLATAIERVGQAVDSNYVNTVALVSALAAAFAEPLGESIQFAGVVRAVLKYRRQKAIQLEMTIDQLASKRSQLEELEKSEIEAKRIEGALKRLDPQSTQPPGPKSLDGSDPKNADSVQPPATSSEPKVHKKKPSSSFKMFNKLNHALHGMIDVDPETTRRNNIGKTREMISQLEGAVGAAKTDTQRASDAIRKELCRFQKDKEADTIRLMVAYARCHVSWAERNLDAWKEAAEEIEKLRDE